MRRKSTSTALFLVFIGSFCILSPQIRLFAQACPGLGSVNLNIVAAPVPTITAPDKICTGANGTVTVNQVFNAYDWSTGESGQSISITDPGTYSVTVSNATGCTGTATVTVNPSETPIPDISQNSACSGSVILDAGAGFTSYAWSDGGGNNQTATYSSAGFYSVTVTNVQGCTGTGDFNAIIPIPPIVSITGDLTVCIGSNTVLDATAGFNSYAWSNGQGSQSIVIANGGTYTVTVTDDFGCTDTESVTITNSTPPVPNVANASICVGGNPVTLNVSNGPFTDYNWSTGSGLSSTEVNVPGDYSVTVTSANGCTGFITVNVAALPTPTPSISASIYACNGQLTLNAGAGFAIYNWSNGSNTPSISITTSGSYTVTVTNAQGCTNTDMFFADIPVPPVVNITGDNSFCSNTTANLSATPGFTNYSWSNGQNVPDINVSNGGNYSLTVTDAFGCTTTDNFIVSQLPAPQPVIAGPASVCDGATATLNTTVSFPDYSWSTSETTASITVNIADTYTVTVTAANGCTGTDSQVLSIIPAPTPAITQAIYNCDNKLLLNAGPGFATYVWSNGGNTATIPVTISGNYSVTVTDAQGCTGTDSYFADIPVSPTVTITGDNAICSGSSTTLTATAGFSSYFWSTGSSNPDITVSTPGNYTVTVTDAFGCTATNVFSVVPLTAPAPNISGPSQICSSGNATFSVPGSFVSFDWSTGETTPTITVNLANTYTVTVTSANGCTATDSQDLVVANSLQPQITALPYACNGQITLDAGSGFTTYQWSGGQNTQSITVNTNGNYTVTVSDAGSCTGTATVTTTIPPLPAVNITGNSTICSGSSTALTATAGLSAYIWSNGQVGNSISVNAAGTYSVTATDAFGCTTTNSFVLNTTTAPTPSITGPSVICINSTGILALNNTFSQYNWSTGATTANITVNSANTYAVTVTDAQGCTGTAMQVVTTANGLSPNIIQLPYTCNGALTLDAGLGFTTYLWSSGENTATINVSTNGSYNVTVTDQTGCTGTGSLMVTVPAISQVTITGNTSFCQNQNTTLTATSGFVNYVWSNGQAGISISTNTAGTYSVTATDASGCTVTDDFLLNVTAAPQPVITGPTVICINSSGTLALTNTFSQYSWSTGATIPNITVNSANTYAVTVTDAQGCTGTTTQIVTTSNSLSPTVIQQPYTCNGALTLDAGASFTTYSWSNGENTATINVTADGTYAVTVTDQTGCTGTSNLTITVPILPQVAITGNNSFCQNENTTLTATPGFVDYLWSGGETINSIMVNQSGTYTVTVTDGLGCTDVESITVTAQPLPQPQIIGPVSICAGDAATFTLGQNFASYTWSDGSLAVSITANNAGTYSVTVTDVNGCTGSDDTELVVNPSPVVTITEEPYACNSQLTLTATTGFNTYNWTGLNNFTANTQQATTSLSGNYLVTITDANGCTATAAQNVIVPTVNQVTLSGPTQFCTGGNVELTASSGFTNYVWSSGESQASITASAVDVYAVTATDALGCTSTASTAVSTFPVPVPAIAGPQAVCPGSSATLILVGGNFNTISWSTGATTASIVGQPPFTATVTVTDANGCTASATASVAVSTQLSPNIVELPYACDGQITLDAGIGFQNYAWSNGQSAAQISITQSGTYMVTVSDGSGCSGTATVEVILPAPAQVSISGDTNLCPAEISTLTATAGFATYIWNDGTNLPTIEVSAAGTYAVTATDALGCTATATITALGLLPPVLAIDGPTTICGSNPVTLNATGDPFSSILWSNAAITPNITINAAGNYSVTVTDVNGCTNTAQTVVQSGGNLSINITQLPYACNGQVTLDAGAGFASYVWSNGSASQTVTITQAGNYTVTVTGSGGCSVTATTQITIPVDPVATISGALTFCAGTSTTLSMGAGFANYAWSNGGNQSSTQITQPGTYTVTVTSASGCSATASATVQTINLSPTLQSNEVFCQGTSLTINVTGTYASYLWSDGSTQSSLTVAQVGTYTVTVTDASGCTGASSSEVLAVPPASVIIAGGSSLCSGSTVLTTLGSVGTFTWSNGATGSPLTVTQPGTYTVTVTDPNGCTATDSIIINPGISIATNIAQQTCRPAEVGTQILTLTATSGCDSVVTIVTTYHQPAGLALDLTPVIEAQAGQEITLNVAANFLIDSVAFSSPFTLSCTNCANPTFTATASASILVMAFDANGCGASEEVRLRIRKQLNIYVPNVFQPGSLQNGFFGVYSGAEIQSVRNFHVFDRWGNALFSQEELPTNDPTVGWDGKFRDQLMQPGVYVYYFEILLADGSKEVYKGDVTIME